MLLSAWLRILLVPMLSGCGLLFPFDDGDGTGGAPTDATSATSSVGGGGGSGAAGGGDVCEPPMGQGGCGDTVGDPKNCGACGRDCLGGECIGGTCTLAAFLRPASPLENFTNVVLRDGEIYVGLTSGYLLHAPLADLGPSADENLAALASVALGEGVSQVAVDADAVFAAKPDAAVLERYALSDQGSGKTLGEVGSVVAMDASSSQVVVLAYGDLLRFDKNTFGQTPASLTSSVGNTSLLLARDKIHWSSSVDSAVYELGLSEQPGKFSVVATNQTSPRGLAADEKDALYWIAESEGFVVRRKKPGIATVVDVSRPLTVPPEWIAESCGTLYFDVGTDIHRVSREAEQANSTIAFSLPMEEPVLQLVADRGILYVVTSVYIYRGVLTP